LPTFFKNEKRLKNEEKKRLKTSKNVLCIYGYDDDVGAGCGVA